MKTMNSKTLFGKNYSLRSRRMTYNRKESLPSDEEESDSEDDERERRKYLSLQVGESFFWSANRLNKNFLPNQTDCVEMNCNYLADRTASMSSFKRNIQTRHSLKHFRRRPLANINDIELYDKFDKNLKLSERALLRKSVTLDDIEMNDNFEYGFNPQRVTGSKANIQVRLRPMSLCGPPRPNSLSVPLHGQRGEQTDSHRLQRRSIPLRRVTSYATNKNEMQLERELFNLRSQSCNLNFQGCEGNLNQDELKESLSMLRRQRFVCRKLTFDFHPKKKWKKTVSLDSGLATENILSKLDVSKSEERLNNSRRDKIRQKILVSRRKKSVEFLDVHNESDTINMNTNKENELTISTESEEATERDVPSLESNEKPEVISSSCVDVEHETISSTDMTIDVHPTHIERTPPDEAEHNTQDGDPTLSPVDEAPASESTPYDTVSSDTSTEKLDMTKSSERIKRLKSGIPHIFSSFRLPSKSTFRKLIRRKTADATTPLKASHGIISIQLFKDRSDDENITSTDDDNENVTTIQVLHDKNTANLANDDLIIDTQSKDTQASDTIKGQNTAEEEKIIIMVGDTGSLGELQSVSLDSLTSYGKMVERTNHKLIDKSVSAYSLPRVDEDKEFSNSLERRSKSSCSISLTKPRGQHHIRHDVSRVRHMSECDLTTYDERPTGCSPGKRLMRRILSPVVCGFPPPEKYGMLNDSMHSLNSYDSGSIASDSEHLQLFDFSSQELVEEMTLIDKELLAHIPWEELSVLGWMSPDKFLLAPNVMKMVQFFNRIAMLVTSNVLNEESTYRRAKVVRKAIKLAYKCRLNKNYNSLKAVLGGLQCTPVFRLKATWKEVPSRYRKTFRDLSELMSEENNFANYRKELNVALLGPPCIPFLGNFLTEVAHTHAYQAIHAKYRATSMLAQKERESWKNDVTKNSILDNLHETTTNGNTNDDDEDGDILQTKRTQSECENTNSVNPRILSNTHSRTDSESSCEYLQSRYPHLRGNTHSRTDSENSTSALLPELTRSKNVHSTDDYTHSNTRILDESCEEVKSHSRSDSEHSNPDILQKSLCLHCDDQGGVFEHSNKDLLNSSCINCKTHSRTDSEHSNPDILNVSLRIDHSRTASDLSTQELIPEPAHTNNKIHSRTDSDDSGVVLNTNKRYSNYIEDLESPRERSLTFPDVEDGTTGDDILQNESLNDKLSNRPLGVDDAKDSMTKNDKLCECECTFGKFQLYGVAYDYPSRPYVRHYLVNSAFNTEEVSYKLSLKREPPKR